MEHKIIIKHNRRRWKITIDGKEYDPHILNKWFGLAKNGVSQALNMRRGKPYEQRLYIANQLWRRENNIPIRHMVYTNPQGCKCTVAIVKKLCVNGEKSTTAANRINKWAKGEIDTDDLFRPFKKSAQKCDPAKSKRAQKSKRYASFWDTSDMAPRKRTSEVRIGSMEREWLRRHPLPPEKKEFFERNSER